MVRQRKFKVDPKVNTIANIGGNRRGVEAEPAHILIQIPGKEDKGMQGKQYVKPKKVSNG